MNDIERIKNALNKLIAVLNGQSNNLSVMQVLAEIQDELNQPIELPQPEGKFAEVVKEEIVIDFNNPQDENVKKFRELVEKGIEDGKPNEFRIEQVGAGWEIRTNKPKETKPTDKELLKECMDLINYYQNNFFNINSNNINVKTQDLLTKLNKHLNHD